MRGPDVNQNAMFSYLAPEERVPADHPLRRIRALADAALRTLSPRFSELYSFLGRRSVPPEKLLRALLLQVLFTIRSERMLMEQLQYNLLFRWFVGMNLDDPVWDVTVFSKNRARLLEGDVAKAFFEAVLDQAREQDWLSDEHFTVDGTLLEAWASRKSFQPKDTPPEQGTGSRGEIRLRDTHESKTDPDARMYRKSASGEFKLCHMGHVLIENRHGLVVNGRLTEASTQGEWEAAVEMVSEVRAGLRRVTLGADAEYDDAKFVASLRQMQVTPHVAQHTRRPSALDGRTTRHAGYAVSLKKRKCVEQIFGWLKTTAGLRKVRHRGRKLVEWTFTFALAACNLIRMSNLANQTP
jgi:transposase